MVSESSLVAEEEVSLRDQYTFEMTYEAAESADDELVLNYQVLKDYGDLSVEVSVPFQLNPEELMDAFEDFGADVRAWGTEHIYLVIKPTGSLKRCLSQPIKVSLFRSPEGFELSFQTRDNSENQDESAEYLLELAVVFVERTFGDLGEADEEEADEEEGGQLSLIGEAGHLSPIGSSGQDETQTSDSSSLGKGQGSDDEDDLADDTDIEPHLEEMRGMVIAHRDSPRRDLLGERSRGLVLFAVVMTLSGSIYNLPVSISVMVGLYLLSLTVKRVRRRLAQPKTWQWLEEDSPKSLPAQIED